MERNLLRALAKNFFHNSQHGFGALINAVVAKMEKVLNDANEIPRNFGIKKLFLYIPDRKCENFSCVFVREKHLRVQVVVSLLT